MGKQEPGISEQRFLQRLIAHERHFRNLAEMAASALRDMFVKRQRHFLVYCEGGQLIEEYKSISPNASTSLVCWKIEQTANDVLPILGPEVKEDLRRISELGRSRLLSFHYLDKPLPLRSFKVLPPFSTAYIALLLQASGEGTNSPLYWICVRRLLTSLAEQAEGSPRGKVAFDGQLAHPFLTYFAASVLDNLIKEKSPSGGESEKNRRLVNGLTRVVSEPALSDLFKRNKNLKGVKQKFFANGRQNIIDQLTSDGKVLGKLEELRADVVKGAKEDIIRQLAYARGPDPWKFDPAALTFSLATEYKCDRSVDAKLLGEGLVTLFDNMLPDGSWQPGLPFYYDGRGRGCLVVGPAIASIAMEVARGLRRARPDLTEQLVDGSRRYADWAISNITEVLVNFQSGQQANVRDKTLRGWTSDWVRVPDRIDSWVTAEMYTFAIHGFHFIRDAKREFILRQYDAIGTRAQMPSWDKIIDPGWGDEDSAKKRMWEIIQQTLEAPVQGRAARVAPTFILYGPPGTAKTTMVTALAHKLGWDLIHLSPSEFIAKGPELIENRSREIFRDLMELTDAVIVFDEMDSLLQDRRGVPAGSIPDFLVPAFLRKLQDLRDLSLRNRLVVCLITNLYERLDPAIQRLGRFDHQLLFLPYNRESRFLQLEEFLGHEIADKHEAFLRELLDRPVCRLAVYRELEVLASEISRAVNEGLPNVDEVIQRLPEPTVGPELYFKRPESWKEALHVLRRYSDLPKELTRFRSMSKNEAKVEFSSLVDKVPNESREAWKKLQQELFEDFARTRRGHRLHPEDIFWVEDVIDFLAKHHLNQPQREDDDSS